MPHPPQIDPIEHAWRHCNPRAPLPSTLVPRATPSGLALSLYSSRARLRAERLGDTRHHLLAVAALPRISPSDERVSDDGIAE